MNISTTVNPAGAARDGGKPEPKFNLVQILLAHARKYPLLWIGLAVIVIPTMASVAKQSWSSEQGAHGPIVLATGIWLILRQARDAAAVSRPGSVWISALGLLVSLLAYAVARITDIIEIEGFAMYGIVLAVFYSACGAATMRALWFPIVYCLFLFPPPDTLVAMITQPLKIMISGAVIDFLHMLGYPIAGSGVTIQIGQYELLVAMACAGLNSLISLSAIGLFYVYIRHNANWRYAALLMVAILPAAIMANFVRVMILVLTTYYFGDAVAQGFLHDFAGLIMFSVAVISIFGIDALASPLRRRLSTSGGQR
jgi:exosortase